VGGGGGQGWGGGGGGGGGGGWGLGVLREGWGFFWHRMVQGVWRYLMR